MILTPLWDMCKANACFRTECVGDCSIEPATSMTLSGPVAVAERLQLLLFKADEVCRKLETRLTCCFSYRYGIVMT